MACSRSLACRLFVVFAAFVSLFLLGGMVYSSGVLFNELLKRPCKNVSRIHLPTWTNASATPIGCEEATCIECEGRSTGNASERTPNSADATDCGGFGESRGSTAWGTSIYLAVGTSLSSVAGVLIDRFGCRAVAIVGSVSSALGYLTASYTPSLVTFVLSYGILGGVGFAFLYTSSIVVVSQHWPKHQAIANGIVMSGVGLGTVAFGPLSNAVIEGYGGWRPFFRFLTFCFIGAAILSLFYASVDGGEERPPRRKLFNWTLWRKPSFVIFIVGIVVIFFGVFVPVSHTIRYARDLCVCTADADLLVTYLGIGSVIGRITVGLLTDRLPFSPLTLYNTCVFFAGVSVLAAPAISSYAGFVSFMLFYGFLSGVVVSFILVVMKSIVAKDELPQALGWGISAQSPSNAVASPIAGWLYDASCSYSNSYFFAGSMFMAGFIVLCLIPHCQTKTEGSGKGDKKPLPKTGATCQKIQVQMRESYV